MHNVGSGFCENDNSQEICFIGFIMIHLNILLLKWSPRSAIYVFLIFSKHRNKICFFFRGFLVAMCQNTSLMYLFQVKVNYL